MDLLITQEYLLSNLKNFLNQQEFCLSQDLVNRIDWENLLTLLNKHGLIKYFS